MQAVHARSVAGGQAALPNWVTTLPRASWPPMPPTHFLRIAGQSARKVTDDGSTEGGITESLALMNGEITEFLMSKSAVMKAAGRKSTEAEQIEFLYRSFFARAPHGQNKQQCIAALTEGIELGDIVWALLNSREFIFIQ